MRSVLLMLVVAATLGNAHADTNWTNGTSTGNWTDADNWDNGLPELQPISPGDFEPDGDVDFADLARLTSFWLTDQPEPSVDIGSPGHQADGIINLFDFAIFAENWTGSMD